MSEENELIHLIYVSAATVPFSPEDLQTLLAKARATNAGMGVTGMLLYVDGSFFQILEGPEEAVDDLFNRIGTDDRHSRVSIIIKEGTAERSFDEWTMGYADVSREDLVKVPGLNDFFVAGSCLADIDRGRARKLLTAFQSGRWRQQIGGKREAMAGRR